MRADQGTPSEGYPDTVCDGDTCRRIVETNLAHYFCMHGEMAHCTRRSLHMHALEAVFTGRHARSRLRSATSGPFLVSHALKSGVKAGQAALQSIMIRQQAVVLVFQALQRIVRQPSEPTGPHAWEIELQHLQNGIAAPWPEF